MISSVVSPKENAFVPRRLITNNILIAYKLLHMLKNSRRGNQQYMNLKLDMGKVYGKVKRGFIDVMIKRVGFFEQWIMACVSSDSYLCDQCGTNWKGDSSLAILLLIYGEGLSRFLQREEQSRNVSGLNVSKTSPSISYSYFYSLV